MRFAFNELQVFKRVRISTGLSGLEIGLLERHPRIMIPWLALESNRLAGYHGGIPCVGAVPKTGQNSTNPGI